MAERLWERATLASSDQAKFLSQISCDFQWPYWGLYL